MPPLADGADAFMAAVVQRVRAHGAKVILTSHDGTLATLVAHRSAIEPEARLALGSDAALAVAVSKTHTLEAARRLGIGVPEGATVTDAREVDDALSRLAFPIVVKPEESWMGEGTEAVRLGPSVAVGEPGLRRAVSEIFEAGGAAVLQEWLPGRREAISLLYADGEVRACFAQVAHRMTPPLGGNSVLRESIAPPPDIAEASRRLIADIDLEGYSEVEFRRDATGRPRLMEINPRLSASVEVAVRAGVDFPLLLYRWAAGLPIAKSADYRLGVRMRWLGGELRWLRHVLRSPELPDSVPAGVAIRSQLGDFLRPTNYDYLSAADLRPALVAGVMVIAPALRSVRAPSAQR